MRLRTLPSGRREGPQAYCRDYFFTALSVMTLLALLR
jgi:hypothetical protein